MKFFIALLLFAIPAFAAETPPAFAPAKDDPVVGDWKSDGLVAQIVSSDEGNYQANLLRAFDTEEKPIAVLKGPLTNLAGDGWAGVIKDSHISISKGDERADLQHITRTSSNSWRKASQRRDRPLRRQEPRCLGEKKLARTG
jgi:hypothetical protein